MSYCRVGPDSDVYVYPNVYGIVIIVCYGGESYQEKTPHDALVRLKTLSDNGLKVPKRALERLRKEIKEENL
jgi:hypothetical protein